ncbi:MAG TPA: DUF4956 domain-containing protein [Spirochaetota bacterium]|nr:DUF4956 domain-containing protein [Spirochaetota bacterium]HOL56955.1 DUF4956 domain-containing protein [Spirochaetota bacterium]HPP04534.1 DUF4956 domain-containing protein [Spirochaetota bacterium]
MDDFEKFLESIAMDDASLKTQLLSLSSLYNIVLSAIIGLLIILIYYRTTSKAERDYYLIQALPILTILMTVIMRMQGARVALFFGIFGVLSIVRFRSSLTDPKGLSFILFAIIMGVLTGIGNYILVLISFVIISLLIFILKAIFKVTHKIEVEIKGDIPIEQFHKIVDEKLKSLGFSYQLVHISGKYEKNKNKEFEDFKRLEYDIFYKESEDIIKKYEELVNFIKENHLEIDIKRRED